MFAFFQDKIISEYRCSTGSSNSTLEESRNTIRHFFGRSYFVFERN